MENESFPQATIIRDLPPSIQPNLTRQEVRANLNNLLEKAEAQLRLLGEYLDINNAGNDIDPFANCTPHIIDQHEEAVQTVESLKMALKQIT